MAESKNVVFSLVMLLATGLVVMGVFKAVNGLVYAGAVNDGGAEAVLERIKPVGQLNTGAPIVAAAAAPAAAAATTGAAARTGEQVYKSACFACHDSGAAGAPKLGDKGAWGARIGQGMDTLMSHATNGFKAMPPRGTCGNCSDDELKNAVEYIVSKSK